MKSESPKLSKRRAILNVLNTQYELIKEIGENDFNWKLSRLDNFDWDIHWTDTAVQVETLKKMKPYQKINHFPGMFMLSRKNYLAKNLNRMRKQDPKSYSFFPKTWVLPAEFTELQLSFAQKANKIYIVKPDSSCQGKGIFLTKDIESLNQTENYIVQEYVKRPFLIEGLKFDLRVYVLVSGCDPLRIFLHKEGLVRFATEPYVFTSKSLSRNHVHLTNYAINKSHKDFDSNAHKRSLSELLDMIAQQGHDTCKLLKKIKKIVIRTLSSIQPSLAHTYKACQPSNPANDMCFEVLGFDILLDSQLNPWLLEVNHSPSFNTDSELDLEVKSAVIKDTFDLLNVKSSSKKAYQIAEKEEINQRTLSKAYVSNKVKREVDKNLAQNLRERWEEEHMGGFVKIYPSEDAYKFEKHIQIALRLWEEITGIKRTRVKHRAIRSKSVNEKKIPPIKKSSPVAFERLTTIKTQKIQERKAIDPCFKLDLNLEMKTTSIEKTSLYYEKRNFRYFSFKASKETDVFRGFPISNIQRIIRKF